jgi:hypothetical protein
MSYKVLVFKPNNPIKSDTILWKAQVRLPPNYSSIASILLSDNIAVNNRRTDKEWEQLLTENGFKFELNFDSEYCKQYIIFDLSLVCFEFEIFACDVDAAVYVVEISAEFILPMLFTLDLAKSGNIFPTALLNRINNRTQHLNNDQEIGHDGVYKYMKQLRILCEHCQLFEVDVSYEIMDK